jgi:amidase
MCDTPESVARLLTVIAGQDENDPRTTISRPQDYLGALGRSMSGIRIGVLQEGFGLRNSDPRSDEVVRSAISHYESLGAIVTEISIPMHLDGASIHCGIVMEGAAQLIFHGNGQGDNWNGFYATSLVETFGSRWRSRPDELPYTAKAMLFLGHHMKKKYHGRYHAKAQNLKMVLRSAYDETFKDFDIIAMPTIPHVADRLPPAYSAMSEIIDASDMLQNTMPFDVTGHPAFSIPCGKVDGLPVGLMLVGRFMDDATVIAAGNAFYRTYDWQSGRRH